MSIRYYFSWFDKGIPNNIATRLKKDVIEKKSLVLISGNPDEEVFESDLIVKKWFSEIGILFDEYYILNNKVTKKDMQNILAEASIIFLCGGYPKSQNEFLVENDLGNTIKSCDSIIIGASAGSMNMSFKWLSSKNTGQVVENTSVVKGIGLDDFYFCTKANQSITDKKLINELNQNLHDTQTFIAIGESAIRIEDKEIGVYGEIYSLLNQNITKMSPSF